MHGSQKMQFLCHLLKKYEAGYLQFAGFALKLVQNVLQMCFTKQHKKDVLFVFPFSWEQSILATPGKIRI